MLFGCLNAMVCEITIVFLKLACNRLIMTYYDEISVGYSELHGAEQRAKAEVILQNLKIAPDDELLDVGCGDGAATALFSCRKTGIDPSAGLLKKAPFKTIHGKAEKLPFPDKSFDIVISLTAVHNFDDVEKSLLEMKRVAKRDIVISVLKRSSRFQRIEKLINTNFKIVKTVEQQHDIIFFCKKDI